MIYLERLDGTFANASAVFDRQGPHRGAVCQADALLRRERQQGTLRDARRRSCRPFTPLQGGIPILVDGKVVGAIGVSGAASAAQDEEIAVAGAAAIGNKE